MCARSNVLSFLCETLRTFWRIRRGRHRVHDLEGLAEVPSGRLVEGLSTEIETLSRQDQACRLAELSGPTSMTPRLLVPVSPVTASLLRSGSKPRLTACGLCLLDARADL